MLGWRIYIHRQVPGVARDDLDRSSLLASWLTAIGGLDWLDQLVEEGKATFLGGDGYPLQYTAIAKHILPMMTDGPPRQGQEVIGDDYFLPAGWLGEVRIDHAKITKCAPDDELYIETWDQS